MKCGILFKHHEWMDSKAIKPPPRGPKKSCNSSRNLGVRDLANPPSGDCGISDYHGLLGVRVTKVGSQNLSGTKREDNALQKIPEWMRTGSSNSPDWRSKPIWGVRSFLINIPLPHCPHQIGPIAQHCCCRDPVVAPHAPPTSTTSLM